MWQGAGFDEVTGIELSAAGKTATVSALDANGRSLRFVVPADWGTSAVVCRVKTRDGVLLRDNVFDDVTVPYEPAEAGCRKIDGDG